MRLLVLTNLYPNALQPHRANHTRQQVRLVGRKSPVSVIAPIAWTDELAARFKGLRLPVGRRTVFDGLPVEHPRYWFTPKMGRSLYGRFYCWCARAAFQRVLREFRPDLVYTPWAYPDGWAAVRLAHEAGLPVVLKVIGSDFLLLSKHPKRQRGTLEALRLADFVVAVSCDLAEQLVESGVDPRKISVIYDGVDPAVFYPGPKAEARSRLGLSVEMPTVLFVGNLVPVKGIDILLEACAQLGKQEVRFQCLLVGEGQLRPQLERQARRCGLAERVRFVGSVANDALPDWYRASDVVALPSYSEGVPNVLLEAAACGTPFVASHVGGIPEIAHLGVSRLVPPNNPGLLAETLASVLAGHISHPCGEAFKPRTRADSADELIELFTSVLQRHRERTLSANLGTKESEIPATDEN